MIESENLRTASLYINNQLLSRGLLRDGNSIDFVHPGDSDGEVAETMSRVMAVVNDLILRRDRDAEQRESLSATLRTLRAESLRQTNDIQRLQEKYADAQRKVGLSEAAEAALRTQLKTAEATVHRLKEEAVRTKTLVAQTRASCANEVRKRDRQIESLKKAVTEAGRARGVGKSTGVTTITVVGDIGSDSEQGTLSMGTTADNSYNLRSETNAFLAELAKGLSEDNEGLLQLVRRTTEQLKDMSGWDDGQPTENGDGHAVALTANPADMSLEVDAVLDHLRTILTNPSFVPIEEVMVREDEIHRLRDGWEKMETRWKEAVHLIDGWRRRMQASGRPVNVEELKMGLRLSPVKVSNVEETTHGFALRLDAVLEDDEIDAVREPYDDEPLDLALQPELDEGESDASSEFEHDVDVDVADLDVEEPNVEILQQSMTVVSSPPLPPPPQLSPLRHSNTAGNRRERPNRGPQSREVETITEEKQRDVIGEDAPLPPPPRVQSKQQPSQKRPLLSLRTVPSEEAASVALPSSAAVSTPDTSVDSIPFSKAADQAARHPPAGAARTQRRPAPSPKKKDPVKKEITPKEPARRKNREETKPAAKPPVKAKPVKPPVNRGRPETRKEEKAAAPARAPPRATPATSGISAVPANPSKPASAAKSAVTDDSVTARPSPAPAPAPSRSQDRSPQRVNSRLPLLRPGSNGVLPAPQQSPLNMATITAKLAASEREADAARVRAKLKAARLGNGVSLPPPGTGNSSSSDAHHTAPKADGTSAGGSSLRSECASVAGSAASTAAFTSDGAHSSTATALTAATTACDEDCHADADELGLSPPVPGQQQQHQQQQQPAQRQEQAQLKKQPLSPSKRLKPQPSAADLLPKARKRERRASKVASRRRSTLNPWELDALIQGGQVTVER